MTNPSLIGSVVSPDLVSPERIGFVARTRDAELRCMPGALVWVIAEPAALNLLANRHVPEIRKMLQQERQLPREIAACAVHLAIEELTLTDVKTGAP